MPRNYDDDPRGRRFRDDDDDRPRRKSRRDEDDDDDRPSRRSRRDEEDDDRPRSRRKSRDYGDEDVRPGRRSRSKSKQMNVVGLVAIIIGGLALVLTITPCLSIWFGIVPAIVGLLVGLFGLYMSQQSDGRQKPLLPIVGMGVSAAAVLVAVGLLVLFKGVEKAGEKWVKEIEAEAAKADAERKVELAQTAKDVQSATDPIRITADALAREFEQNHRQAERRYGGKVLEVTGVVEDVDFEDLEDEYRVVLRAGVEDTVDCDFIKSPDIQARLRQLRPGTQVTIRGKCIDSTLLEGCILVK